MDKDKLIKLIRLANNNPNENEANLAARKACEQIQDLKIAFRVSTLLGTANIERKICLVLAHDNFAALNQIGKQPNTTSKIPDMYEDLVSKWVNIRTPDDLRRRQENYNYNYRYEPDYRYEPSVDCRDEPPLGASEEEWQAYHRSKREAKKKAQAKYKGVLCKNCLGYTTNFVLEKLIWVCRCGKTYQTEAERRNV